MNTKILGVVIGFVAIAGGTAAYLKSQCGSCCGSTCETETLETTPANIITASAVGSGEGACSEEKYTCSGEKTSCESQKTSCSGEVMVVKECPVSGKTCSESAGPDADENEVIITFAELPEAARAAALQLAGTQDAITQVEREDIGGVVSYGIEFMKDGAQWSADISAAGAVSDFEREGAEEAEGAGLASKTDGGK